jgi:hypothetical protein
MKTPFAHLLAALATTHLAFAQSSPAPLPQPAADDVAAPSGPAAPPPSPPAVPAAAPPAAVMSPAAVGAGPSRPLIDLGHAPESSPCPEKGEPAEGAGVFFIGAGWFDLASVNRHLRANGYERIGSPLTLLGGEGHAVTPSGFIIGARGAAIMASEGSGPDGLRRNFGGGFGMIDLGYALVNSAPLLVSVVSSLGGYGLELGIGDGQTTSFDAALQNPRRSTSIGRGGLLVGLGLGIDGRVPMGEVDARGGRGFFTFGARVGALYGPALGGFSLAQGGEATGGPGAGLTGIYTALTLGFGGGRDRAHRQ